ncbi:SGNH/GDSL hydrolase family protein [Sphingomonas humi]|uniref:SGNH/GDSL hydrolase family protein n=1 Tax=Sphingomonas humi TaxID=335630 RepID=A0ABP7S488_9SPHN
MKSRACLLPLVASCLIGAAPVSPRWVPGWYAPPIGYEPQIKEAFGRPFNNDSVRQSLYSTVAGTTIRVRLSNELSATRTKIGAATIVRLDANGEPVEGSLRPLTFANARSVLLPAGAPMLSDPIRFPVKAGERLAVSVFYPEETALPGHAQMVDVAAEDVTGATRLPNPRRARATGIVSALEVVRPSATRVLVALGDSITEGAGSTRAQSYPDQLGRLLAADAAGRCWTVVNAGISSNRLLSEGRGPNALSRFDRDVLAVPNVTHVAILEGINDIGRVRDPAKERQPAAGELIAAYEQLLARASARGVKVIFGTLLPYEGAAYADAEGEKRRSTVNQWLRANKTRFAGLIDFDLAMREPGQPTVMRLSQQIGDHLHPNDAGYATMARTALPVVRAQGCR